MEKKTLQTSKEKRLRKSSDRIQRSPAVPLTFVLTGLLLTVLYMILQFFPFGEHSVILSDLGAQYAPYLVAYKNQFLSGTVGTYSFLIGMGKNTLGLFAYYLASPINFVTFLFPSHLIAESVLVLIGIKLSLAASFMTLFLRNRFQTQSKFAVLFGILYAFSTYAMVYMINIMWMDGFYLLPLLLYFIDQFMENRARWWKVSLTLWVLFVSGFYIAYMVGIFSFLYLLARLFEERSPSEQRSKSAGIADGKSAGKTDGISAGKTDGISAGKTDEISAGKPSGKTAGKTVLAFLGSTALAVGMSAALLLPAGMDILRNPDRSAGTIALDSNFSFVDFLNQLLAGSFDSLASNKPLVYCGIMALLLCGLFFLNPHFSRRQKGITAAAIVFLVLSFNMTLLNLAWQLFDSPNWFQYRYSFLLVFVILVTAFASLLHVRELKPKAFVTIGLGFLALLIIVQKSGDLADNGALFYINLFFGVLILGCLYASTGVNFHASIANLKRLVPVLLVIIVCIEAVIVNPLYIRPKMFGGEAKREPLSSAVIEAEPLVAKAKVDEETSGTAFFRMEMDGGLNDGIGAMNAGLYLDYPSISTFNSSSNKDLNRFLKQLGYDTNYNYFASSHAYTSVAADSLLGIRYILSGKEELAGYQQVASGSQEKIYLYRNDASLPLMYLVNSDAASFDFFALERNPATKNPFEFQDSLLVSLFGEAAFSAAVYTKADSEGPVLYNAIQYIPMEMTPEMKEVVSNSISKQKDSDLLGEEPVWVMGRYMDSYLRTSEKDQLSLTYSIHISSTDPLYMSIPAVVRNSEADIYVNGAYTDQLSSSSYTRILNLGSFLPGETVEVTLRSNSDIYSCLPALFYYCDTDLFADQLSLAVSGQDVQITKIKNGWVSAQVTAEEDQLLLTTIPYEKGWTLRIDGKETSIEAYQNALICIPLTAGTHTITLSFTAPGVWAGGIISGVSILAFAGVLVFAYRKRSSKE